MLELLNRDARNGNVGIDFSTGPPSCLPRGDKTNRGTLVKVERVRMTEDKDGKRIYSARDICMLVCRYVGMGSSPTDEQTRAIASIISKKMMMK